MTRFLPSGARLIYSDSPRNDALIQRTLDSEARRIYSQSNPEPESPKAKR